MTYKYQRYGIYKSKFEDSLAKWLRKKKIKFSYEKESFQWLDLLKNSQCLTCESRTVGTWRQYTPDFFIESSEDVKVIEAKGGRFKLSDRNKITKVMDNHPELRKNFVMVFANNGKLTKRSKNRYSDWCQNNGIQYCIGIDNLKDFL